MPDNGLVPAPVSPAPAPAPASESATAAAASPLLWPFLKRGLWTAAICAGVAGLLSVATSGTDRWFTRVVYSVIIGLFCWLFIDGGRLALASAVARWRGEPKLAHSWPGWGWTIVSILPLGSFLGYFVGATIADAVTGFNVARPLLSRPNAWVGVLVIATLLGGAFTYFFYSREKIAESKAQAQAARRAAAENQLRLLQSQLEPHMLFNTLANLRVLIGVDPVRAQAMLDALIAFLRATLSASRTSLHPLSAELGRIGDYLGLMAVRMGARLQHSVQWSEELADWPVPPLLLQPLVENSIKHGLEPKVAGGRIDIVARRDGERLLIEVRDTGLGLGGGLTRGAADAGFGLEQVRERLRTLYGERASFTLEVGGAGDGAGDDDSGCIARIRLPREANK